jgi:predicted enzyme related to lactoylglutathione lyase
MANGRFERYELRTTDLNAARAFYTDVFGLQFWRAELSIVALPERAAAQGAPAHWLGHIGVRDVERTVGEMVALGGQQLGPMHRRGDGSPAAVLRDPFGAVLAISDIAPALRGRAISISDQTSAVHGDAVAWHLSCTRDHERAFAAYAALFGWSATELLDRGELGWHQHFAWDESRRTVGSMSDGARLPHVHPQWLFFFPVDDIAAAVARVRAHGGLVVDTMQTASGDLVAPCDDAQGAAFGLYQHATVG